MINRALKPIELEVIDIYSYTSTSFPLKLLINNNKKKKKKVRRVLSFKITTSSSDTWKEMSDNLKGDLLH